MALHLGTRTASPGTEMGAGSGTLPRGPCPLDATNMEPFLWGIACTSLVAPSEGVAWYAAGSALSALVC